MRSTVTDLRGEPGPKTTGLRSGRKDLNHFEWPDVRRRGDVCGGENGREEVPRGVR